MAGCGQRQAHQNPVRCQGFPGRPPPISGPILMTDKIKSLMPDARGHLIRYPEID
jgi:hypothetical protein